MSRFLTLAAMAAVLTAVVVWEVAPLATTAPDPIPARQALADPVRSATGSTSDVPAAPWVKTALERPLFRENRRPAKAVGGAVQADGTARLTGVMTGPFGNRAIFMSPGDSKPIVIGEGARVSDFTVRAIGPGLAIVEIEGSVRTLRPSFASDGLSARP